jgi:uncharacterized protein YndB with AHSA1/START domain
MLSNKFELLLDHSAQTIWETIFDPAAAEHWLGTVASILPERRGAAFCWLYDAGARRPTAYVGRIVELNRPHRLELIVSLVSCEHDIHMTFELIEPEPGKTRLTLRQDGFPEQGPGRFELDGFHHHWDHFLDLLREHMDGSSGNYHLMHRTELGVIPVGAIPGTGMLVQDVAIGAPAEQAKVRAGDIIRSADGFAFDSLDDLDDWVEAHKPGDTVNLLIGDRTVPVVLRGKRYSPA